MWPIPEPANMITESNYVIKKNIVFGHKILGLRAWLRDFPSV